MELWDAYDRELNKLGGVTLVRGEEVPDGMYHLVSEVIVKHTDGEFLLMRDIYHSGDLGQAACGRRRRAARLYAENPRSTAPAENCLRKRG